MERNSIIQIHSEWFGGREEDDWLAHSYLRTSEYDTQTIIILCTPTYLRGYDTKMTVASGGVISGQLRLPENSPQPMRLFRQSTS